jgi:hypothetical protein
VDPVPYQPELSRWSQAWRYLAVVAIGVFAWFELAQWQWEHQRWWFWTDLALGLVSLALVTDAASSRSSSRRSRTP